MTRKPFGQALVVGKFAPLHRGHELVIETARAQADRVLVLSYTNPEFDGLGPALRRRWLAELFGELQSVVLDAQQVRRWGLVMPNNDDAGELHREFVARVCHEILGVVVDAVFTSEDYGEPLAAALSRYYSARLERPQRVSHVSVDPGRVQLAVSGTAIRRDLYALRSALDPRVYASMIARVALLGPESSGKTTLAHALALALRTRCADEYGRQLWTERQGQLDEADLLAIAREQVRREESLLCQSREVLVCDTSPLTTLAYSQLLFGRVAPELAQWAKRQYDLIVYCAADFEFVQDGTRVGPGFQREQDAFTRDELRRRGIDVLEVRGSIVQRLTQVLAVLRERGLVARSVETSDQA